MGKLVHVRIQLAEANAFVAKHHRHHRPVIGHIFSLGAVLDEQIVGVVIVGRPVSRRRDDGETAEVTRLCTDGTRNACSFLYGAAARAAFAGLVEACAAAGFGALDDGAAAGLAPGVRNRAIAALGDAIVPNIAEAIGRAMRAVTAP